MKVNIDLYDAFGHSGIANYKRNMAIGLLDYSDIELTGCYNFCRNAGIDKYNWFRGRIKRSFIPEKLLLDTGIPFISYETMMNSCCDVNLFLTYRLPKIRFKRPVVSTIHDLIVLRAKSESESFQEEHLRILKNSIEHSDHILTVSSASKKDIIDYFGISADRITVVHNGINLEQYNEVLTKEKKEYLRNKYHLPDVFILYFGGYRVHKNIERLLQAYALLPKEIKSELKLVITNNSEVLKKLAGSLGILENCFFSGFVDEEDKCGMYKAASITYYGSLYEGFGVPIIESQICRTPVITSNTSSLPEAAGGGAYLFDPYNVDEIREAIIKLYSDKEYRSNLIEVGYLNATNYSWKRGTKELHDFLIQKF